LGEETVVKNKGSAVVKVAPIFALICLIGFVIAVTYVERTRLKSAADEKVRLERRIAGLNFDLTVVRDQLDSAENETTAAQAKLASSEQALVTKVQDLNAARASLDSKTKDLAAAYAELTTARTTLSNTQSELSAANAEVVSSRVALSRMQSDLSVARKAADELVTAKRDLTTTNSELFTLRSTLYNTQNQLATAQQAAQDMAALKTALAKATSQVRYRDPTWSEVVTFLAADRRDGNTYVPDKYVCWDFAGDVNRNAEAQGIRAGWVYIDFADGAHAIVAFDTIDRGIVYIEPQTDREVTLRVGAKYWRDNGYSTSFDDTILRFGVIW
jgi:predicted  nucleic acid-binding Zn-ribbon protein